MTLVQRRAYLDLFDRILQYTPDNAEIQVRACNEFLAVDVFAITDDEIYSNQTCYRFNDKEYESITCNTDTSEGCKQVQKYVLSLYNTQRKVSFIADLLGITTVEVARALKQPKK